MKIFYTITIIIFSLKIARSQTITNHSTTGTQSTFIGGCGVGTCNGAYFDNGGSIGTYSNNIPSIYQIFCPTTPNTCVRMTFNSFVTELGYDFMTIGNGATQNAPAILLAGITNAAGRISGNYAGFYPFSFTSSNSSGCLAPRFTSDFSNVNSGWSATISCVPCAQWIQPTNSDCNTSQTICSNTPITANSPGPGLNVTEGCADCVTSEHYTSWYTFSPSTSGTFTFTIVPNVATDDYDFAVYGPNALCAALGAPIRCSYAANTGNTGLQVGAGDNSETVAGNGFVNSMNVTAGQVYKIMVNNFSPGGNGYTLSFGGTASLTCSILAAEMADFKGEAMSKFNNLTWLTHTENDNDYFKIERSSDAYNWKEITKIKSQGDSESAQSYSFNDYQYIEGELNYYKLIAVDYNGAERVYPDLIVINSLHRPSILKSMNMLGQIIDNESTELRVIYYSDGTFEKKAGK